jgi:hypothetical protein
LVEVLLEAFDGGYRLLFSVCALIRWLFIALQQHPKR